MDLPDRLLIPGIGSLALAVAAATLGLIVSALLRGFERRGGERVYIQEYRYRFYAVFTAMMLVLVCFGLGYFIYAEPAGEQYTVGFFEKVREGYGWALILFAGASVLPVLSLELVYTRNYSGVGFTVVYGQVLDAIPKSSHFHWARRHLLFLETAQKKCGKWLWRLVSVYHWLYKHLALSALGLYSWYSIKELNKSRWDKAARMAAAEDVLVFLTTWIFILALASGIYVHLSGHLAPSWVLDLLTIVSAVVFLGALLAFYTLGLLSGKIRSIRQFLAVTLPLLFAFALATDFFQFKLPQSWSNGFAFFGGAAPFFVLLLLLWLGHLFSADYNEIQLRLNDLLSEGISANFLDRSLHNFGNAFPSIEAAFRAGDRLVTQLETTGSASPEAETARTQFIHGREALTRAKETLAALKTETREVKKPEWVPVAETLESLRGRIEAAHCAVEVRPVDVADCGLHVPPDLFRKALENLVDNATREMAVAHTEEPVITLRFGPLGQKEEDEALRGGLYLEVADNGPGIRDEVRDRIFDPYVSTATTGMGIGLTMVKKFVEEHRGGIDFESPRQDIRCGVVFRMRFAKDVVRITPLAKEPERARRSQPHKRKLNRRKS